MKRINLNARHVMAMGISFRAFLAAGILAALSSGAAQAQTQGQTGGDDSDGLPRTMQILDTDRDGKVTLDEITAEQKRLFGAADLDGDGKLSVEEFRRRGRWFQRLNTTTLFDLMDANGDGVLTAEEIGAPSARWFKRYDRNGDSSLEPAEVPQFQDAGRRFHGKQ